MDLGTLLFEGSLGDSQTLDRSQLTDEILRLPFAFEKLLIPPNQSGGFPGIFL